jgi:predicted AlkP superfamily pyrophosphatase or phosphodiesterase
VDLRTTNFSRLQIALFTGLVVLLFSACDTQPQAIEKFPQGTGGINAPHQVDKPYLILVSIDGFRWDYMDRYPTPNMDRLAAKGTRAERLLPVFPTLTFPNHYSIATGLYPANHGLVANEFPDPVRDTWYSLKNRETVEDGQFYDGEPIWVSAETQGMVSAAFFFVGTEAPIKGVSPTHWRSFDKKIPGEERVDQILTWLAEPEEKRPHLYTLYFEDVDDHSHWYGPDSKENIEAVSRVDAYMGRLLSGIDKLPYGDRVNIILLSDHGQAAFLKNQPPFILGDHVDLKDTEIVEGGSYLYIHLDQNDPDRAADIVKTVNTHWDHGRAYLPTTAPENWHISNNLRFPDVILMPETGFAVLSSSDMGHKINAGDHGWAPEAPEMHGIFIASGPNIKTGHSLGPVNNIDVYPFMLSLLGLEAPGPVDGDIGSLIKILNSTED